MSKSDGIEAEGKVTAAHKSGFFTCELENGHKVLCRPSGKMNRGRVKIAPTDVVKIELCAADLSRGRIVWRYLT